MAVALERQRHRGDDVLVVIHQRDLRHRSIFFRVPHASNAEGGLADPLPVVRGRRRYWRDVSQEQAMPDRIAMFRGVNWARCGEKQDAFKPNARRCLPRLRELERRAWINCRSTTSSSCARRRARRGRWRWPASIARRWSKLAENLMEEKRVAAVRVSKETLDEDTREFQSVVILSKGKPRPGRKRKPVENREPLCVTPAGSLQRPRPRPHRPAAGRLAERITTPRRSSCCTGPTWWEARRRRQRAAARRPEDRRARGAGARHLGARADPQLPGPDRARDHPGAGRRAARAVSRALRTRLRRRRRAASPASRRRPT